VILAGGLYILLYGPVKKFMQKRVDYYKDMDAAANAKLAEAENSKTEYDRQLAEVQTEISAKRAESDKKAKAAADAKIAAADEEGRKIIAKAKENAGYEKEKILAEANSEIEAMVNDAVDKMLASKTGDPFDDFLDSVSGGDK
jgi:F-type H+-transporting ATPase subunit b